jgi:signal transduction histidine kinase
MIATMLANALLTIVLLYYWRTERTYPGFLLIAGNQLLMAVGFLLVALRGAIPDLPSIVLGNGLIVLAIVLLYDGLVQFYEDRQISNRYYLAVPLGIGGFVLFWYGWDLPVARVLLLSVIIGPLLLVAGFRIVRSQRQGSALPLFIAVALVFCAVSLGIRALVWYLHPDSTVLLNPTPENILFQVFQLVLAVTVPTVYLLDTARRLNSELRDSRSALEELADRFDLAISAAKMGVWDLDLAERRLIWDERIYELFRVPPDERDDLFSRWHEWVEPEDRDRIREAIRHATETGKDITMEFRLLERGGESRTVQASARVLADASGARSRLVGVMHDVSDVRRGERALRTAVTKLNLLSSITRHDIQNQLTALTGWLDLAEEQAADCPELIETVVRERRVVERIGRQIAFTREYENLGVHSPCWQHLGEVVGRAIRDAPVPAVDVQPGLETVEVWADPMLPRVFYNLLENSARHAESARRVKIDWRIDDDRLVVGVEDNGVGVPMAEKERIFERGVGKNTGFGLFMSREILGLTGIGIAETGVPGQGARFEVSVPREVFRVRDPGGDEAKR